MFLILSSSTVSSLCRSLNHRSISLSATPIDRAISTVSLANFREKPVLSSSRARTPPAMASILPYGVSVCLIMPLFFTAGLAIIVEKPVVDRHVPLFQEVPEVFFIDAVVPAGESESFKPAALNPFEYRALADLAVVGDVPGRESYILSVAFSGQCAPLLFYAYDGSCVLRVPCKVCVLLI
jgi:hypothetical protein